MKDLGVVFALVIATFGAGVVTYFGWPERAVLPKMGMLIKVLWGALAFLWLSVGMMWFNV